MIITLEILQEATGYKDASRIRKCLTQQGIVCFTGKNGRIWTTSELIAHAGSDLESGEIEFISED